MRELPRHAYASLAHPLSQLEAALEFFANAQAFVQDEWAEFYKDAAPDEESVIEYLEPDEFLPLLARLGLRFELAGTDPNESGVEGFWSWKFVGSYKQVLIYRWLQQVTSALEGAIDARVVHEGLLNTDLIFVPDADELAKAASRLATDVMVHAREVEERQRADEKRTAKLWRPNRSLSRALGRGEGPRRSNLVLADKAAIALRDAGKPLTPSEVARKLKAKNVASVTTTLHQICRMRRPKRLAGCVRQTDDGRYAWVDET